MNILIPNPPGGERAGELAQTTLAWDGLSPADKDKYLKQFGDPNSGVRLDFSAQEAKSLCDQGRFNVNHPGGWINKLEGANTQTFVDSDKDVMVNIFGKYMPSAHGPADNTLVGTVYPQQITTILEKVLTPA